MLDLTKKRCTMGIINNRIELHGDREVTAFDIPITMLLDPDELCAMRDDPHSHQQFFNIVPGKVATPLFEDFKDFKMKHDLEGATITLHLGVSDYEIEFEGADIKDRTLSFVHGGETQMQFKVQCNPLDKHITKLINAQNTELKISVADAKIAETKKRKQRELPLGADPRADGDAEDGDENEKAARAQADAFDRGKPSNVTTIPTKGSRNKPHNGEPPAH